MSELKTHGGNSWIEQPYKGGTLYIGHIGHGPMVAWKPEGWVSTQAPKDCRGDPDYDSKYTFSLQHGSVYYAFRKTPKSNWAHYTSLDDPEFEHNEITDYLIALLCVYS